MVTLPSALATPRTSPPDVFTCRASATPALPIALVSRPIATANLVVMEVILLALISEAHRRLLAEDQRPHEAIRRAGARDIEAHGQHAGDLALHVDDVLRGRLRQLLEGEVSPAVP